MLSVLLVCSCYQDSGYVVSDDLVIFLESPLLFQVEDERLMPEAALAMGWWNNHEYPEDNGFLYVGYEETESWIHLVPEATLSNGHVGEAAIAWDERGRIVLCQVSVSEELWESDPYEGFDTLLHEIGHCLGLEDDTGTGCIMDDPPGDQCITSSDYWRINAQ